LFPKPAARMWELAGCAPLVVTGLRLARVRTMLENRALDEMFLGRTTRVPANVAEPHGHLGPSRAQTQTPESPAL
jgi:hypothetical protein